MAVKMEMLCFRLPGHGDATLKHMNLLRARQHFCDITIEASDRKTFRGHKVVLAACSPFLRDQFLLNPSSNLQVSVLHSSSVVCDLLQSCYTGVLQFSPKEIVNYLTAASYLQMEHVVEKCRGALNKYMQPRNSRGAPRSIKTEEESMPVFVSGSSHTMCSVSPPADQSTSVQLHSPQQSQDDITGTHTQTDARHDNGSPTLDEPLIKVKVSEEDKADEDYEVFQVCINDDNDQELAERQEGEEDGGEAAEELQGGGYHETDRVIMGDGSYKDVTPAEMALRISGFEKEGLSAWRRRLSEPKGGGGQLGRGFKKRKWSPYLERRPLGLPYQNEWHLPTAVDIMGEGFGLDFIHEKMRSGGYLSGELPRGVEFGVGGEAQGEDGSGPVHYSFDDSSGGGGGEGGLGGLGSVPTDEGAGDESVAVVGSTSSTVAGPVSCEHCGLTFPSALSLAVHSRSTHLLYVCPCCGKHFNHSSNLNRHMSVHQNAKTHRCPLCHKTFTQKSTLCDHMNLHSGERPHRCAYCRARFAHKPALRRHLKEQHGKTTGQNCIEEQAERERESAGGGVGGGGGGEGGGGEGELTL